MASHKADAGTPSSDHHLRLHHHATELPMTASGLMLLGVDSSSGLQSPAVAAGPTSLPTPDTASSTDAEGDDAGDDSKGSDFEALKQKMTLGWNKLGASLAQAMTAPPIIELPAGFVSEIAPECARCNSRKIALAIHECSDCKQKICTGCMFFQHTLEDESVWWCDMCVAARLEVPVPPALDSSVFLTRSVVVSSTSAAASAFDPAEAKICVKLCGVSYQPESALSVAEVPDAIIRGKVSVRMDSFGYLAVHGTRLYVVFRGTCTLQNVATDLAAVLSPLPYPLGEQNLKVHHGFASSYFAMRYQILSNIKTSLAHHPEVTTVVFSGHSLGGALAVLASFDAARVLLQPLGKAVRTVTFGCPRVGNEEYATVYNALIPDSWRVANRGDPVTAVPLWSLPFPYKHVNTLVLLKDGETLINPDRSLLDNLAQFGDAMNHVTYMGEEFPRHPFKLDNK